MSWSKWNGVKNIIKFKKWARCDDQCNCNGNVKDSINKNRYIQDAVVNAT